MKYKTTLAIIAAVLGLFAVAIDQSAINSAWANAANDAQHQQAIDRIRQSLLKVGLTIPITHIVPTPIEQVYEVKLNSGNSLLVSADAKYLVMAQLESNPSAVTAIEPSLMVAQPAGTPVSVEHKAALLANMTKLSAVTSDSQFFYTNMPNVLWGMSGRGGSPFLVSVDAKYLIGGDIATVANGELQLEDLAFERAKNRHVLAKLDERNLVIYPAKDERAVVYVATDINCPYCRLFHKNINEYNKRGITVKAIGFPNYDESIEPMKSIWCQDDKKRATLLASAMRGIYSKSVPSCTPVGYLQTIQQAYSLDILATPAIFNAQGELFVGEFDSEAFYKFAGISVQ